MKYDDIPLHIRCIIEAYLEGEDHLEITGGFWKDIGTFCEATHIPYVYEGDGILDCIIRIYFNEVDFDAVLDVLYTPSEKKVILNTAMTRLAYNRIKEQIDVLYQYTCQTIIDK